MFFFVSDLKIANYNNYQSSITMLWTGEENIFCITTYLETKSFRTVQAKFRRKFNYNNYPQKSQIYHLVHKFQATGLVNNLNKKVENPRSGRKLTARCPDYVDVVRDSVGRYQKKSLWRRFQELSLSHVSLQRILKKDLKLYLYRIQIKHELTSADMKRRSVMCWLFENNIEEDPDFLDDIWFSNKAHFGFVDISKAITVCTGAQKPQTRFFRGAPYEVHSLGGHLKIWNNRTVLVWEDRWGTSHCHKGALHWWAEQVLEGI